MLILSCDTYADKSWIVVTNRKKNDLTLLTKTELQNIWRPEKSVYKVALINSEKLSGKLKTSYISFFKYLFDIQEKDFDEWYVKYLNDQKNNLNSTIIHSVNSALKVASIKEGCYSVVPNNQEKKINLKDLVICCIEPLNWTAIVNINYSGSLNLTHNEFKEIFSGKAKSNTISRSNLIKPVVTILPEFRTFKKEYCITQNFLDFLDYNYGIGRVTPSMYKVYHLQILKQKKQPVLIKNSYYKTYEYILENAGSIAMFPNSELGKYDMDKVKKITVKKKPLIINRKKNWWTLE